MYNESTSVRTKKKLKHHKEEPFVDAGENANGAATTERSTDFLKPKTRITI